MTFERICKAAIAAMANGTKRAHCFSAHVPGQGYINDGTRADLEPEYRRQLVQAAQSELDNMGFAPGYAEPGYTDPKHGVLFANWNRFPRNFDRVLEKAGYACEWSDEWANCEDCQKLVRTVADSFCWEPAYRMGREDCGFFCVECFNAMADESDEDEDKDELPHCANCDAPFSPDESGNDRFCSSACANEDEDATK